MIEYILLARPKAGIRNQESEIGDYDFCNFLPDHALELANLVKGRNVMVNLIPWNAVDERHFVAPSGNAIHRFQDILIKNGVHTRIRRERGADIGSACGQLRLKAKNDDLNNNE